MNFNPRTPVGCDSPFHCRYPNLLISIHAPQWGATVRFPVLELPGRYFNPRTPVGCDGVLHSPISGGTGISIHAPQWGATFDGLDMGDLQAIFQSTHPSGVRQLQGTTIGAAAIFQSTHPSGVRLTKSAAPAVEQRFQSTHPSGVRPREWA